jgi:SAM-dependent methyltransferase
MSLERGGRNSNSDSSTGDSSVAQPFGRQDYWESFYRNQQVDFSWYSAWQDIEPFLLEWIVAPNPLLSSLSSSSSRADTKDYYTILLPGIGSDVSLVENLYHAGFQNLYAFDYAQESIDYCRQRMKNITTTIDFRTADARDLTGYNNNNNKNELLQDEEEPFYFDAVIDKGTLDAIFLSGTTTVERIQNLKLAIQEMQRLLRPSTGIFWSLSGI